MEKTIRCDCGFVASAADEDALVAEIRRHARVAHGMSLSENDALLLAFQAELSQYGSSVGAPPPATPSKPEHDPRRHD
jgi:hypothetical protein